ncbi:LPS export ABC transporter permease LptF [Desulfosarcina alkanivorans]|uniref:LPS export ABC transporter permease LptF n=1 Tax=Desulfosarcina alkanivorans TaxID=571177 RepID=A0A5K7YG03_9BACT|nr:LPS export ABC transporter permease LptF [Desulfosarcina alkanivorans]BBO67503.1 LPS export ABC transporter permease LptF [Desulfosarcina alkanivorans]
MYNPFSIINRYLFLEMLPPFFINLAFFSFIFLMKQILDITDMIVNHKVGVGPVCLLLVYTMPYFLQYVIPMSVMMAVLMTLLRLSGDNEIMALKAGGVSVYRLLAPVLAFSLIGTLLTGYMTLFGVPHGSSRFKTLLFNVATANLNVGLKARTFNDSFDKIMLYVNKIDPHNGELHSVFIEDHRNKEVNNTVVAKTGRIVGDPKNMIYHLRLFEGTINQMDMKDRSSHVIHFETYDIRLDIKAAMTSPGTGEKGPKEMTAAELKAYMHQVKRTDKERFFGASLQLQKKFAIPVACIAMGLLALPLGVQTKNSQKAFGIGLGLFFFLLYYLLMSIGTAFGENGKYPPALGMWVPNLTLGGFGTYLLVRSAREKPSLFRWLDPIVARAIKWAGKK